MKIGVDIRVLMDKHYSGVSIFSLNLLENLIKIDKLNTYSFFYNSFKSINIDEKFKKSSVQTFYPNKIFNYLMQDKLALPKIDSVLGGTDIFYMPHINFASLSDNTKKVITIHDLSFLTYPEFFSNRKNFWHKSLNIKKMLNKFDKIVSVSENTKKDLIEILGIEESRIEVVYPGLSTFKDVVDDKNVLSKYNIKKDYILYLGTIEPRKNIVNLIKSYNILRDRGFSESLVLAGSWGWKTKEISKEWLRSKYKEDIVFTGYISEDEKPAFYKNAKIFVYPSLYEGFGFPPLEAMSFSVPVISSNNSSLPEVLQDAALLVNSDKNDELCEAMEFLLRDDNLRNNYIIKGKERCLDFSWEKTAMSYLNIFNKL
ncbi:MAG: glycosyltransferase family 1 protein [Patescibacteria group bacterium]